MKKEERTFSQMVKEVIDHAKLQARNQWQDTNQGRRREIDKNANIADEWLRGGLRNGK